MIKVLVIEDSPTVRRQLVSIYSSSTAFEVVGSSETGQTAREMVRLLKPDLVSLDVFLPNESAANVVRDIREVSQAPVVLVSNAPRSSAEVFEAIAAGAVDVVQKPSRSDDAASAFLELMRIYARARPAVPRPRPRPRGGPGSAAKVVVVAASTGGPPALLTLVAGLGRNFPLPVLVAQHLASGFERGLAEWLAPQTGLLVQVAESSRPLVPGELLLGKPGTDLVVADSSRVQVVPATAGLHPSADRLFTSAAEVFGDGVVGIVLTGMGSDGAKGAKAIVDQGGVVFVQDRGSSAVYGMPQAITRAKLAKVTGTPVALARALRELGERVAAAR